MKRSLLLSLLIFSFGLSNAQPRTRLNVDENAFEDYAAARASLMRYNVGKAVSDGKISAYADAGLRKKYSAKELDKLLTRCETIEVPTSPDDPDATKDTTVCTPFDPSNITGWTLHQVVEMNQWLDVSLIGVQGRVFTIDNEKDTILYYISPADLRSLLQPEDERLFAAFLGQIGNLPSISQAQSKLNTHIVEFNDTTVKNFASKWFHALAEDMYAKMRDGKLIAYASDSLSRTILYAQFNHLWEQCDTRQVQVNPQDPDETVDSVICTPYDPKRILGFSLNYEWTMRDNGPASSLRGIAPLSNLLLAGIELPVQVLYWHKMEDVKRSLSAKDWLLLTDVFNFALLSSVEKEYYRR